MLIRVFRSVVIIFQQPTFNLDEILDYANNLLKIINYLFLLRFHFVYVYVVLFVSLFSI